MEKIMSSLKIAPKLKLMALTVLVSSPSLWAQVMPGQGVPAALVQPSASQQSPPNSRESDSTRHAQRPTVTIREFRSNVAEIATRAATDLFIVGGLGDSISNALSQRFLGGAVMQGGNKEYESVQRASVDEALRAAIEEAVKTLADRFANE
ncbi:MAG: hypothetical protein C4K60_13130 [Ideonella sp. MAG2]|nr:MAG: hypothetical protein C4K60_13130 [Ideonella sp. MAG2]